MKKNYFLIIIFGFLISCSENKKESAVFSIVIHGGAGTMDREKMSIEKELEYKKTLEEAWFNIYPDGKTGGVTTMPSDGKILYDALEFK